MEEAIMDRFEKIASRVAETRVLNVGQIYESLGNIKKNLGRAVKPLDQMFRDADKVYRDLQNRIQELNQLNADAKTTASESGNAHVEDDIFEARARMVEALMAVTEIHDTIREALKKVKHAQRVM
jgi:DNA anti-recombination protein RmuC